MSIREAIQRHIGEFLGDSKPETQWLKPAVRAHFFLPLYIGWVSVLGIRPDGSVVRWDYESDRENVRPVADGRWQRMALVQGAKKYPELSALLPARSHTAQTCGACGGSGMLKGAHQLICECGGIGWIMPGEPREPPPGE